MAVESSRLGGLSPNSALLTDALGLRLRREYSVSSPAYVVGLCFVLTSCAPASHPALAPGSSDTLRDTALAVAPQPDLAAMSLALMKLQKEVEARNKRIALYEEGWRLKVESVGAANYPPEARGLSASLRLRVWINSDGTVDAVVIDRSSGNSAVDEAALNIVRLASPFPAFPPDLAKDTKKLVINRTWFFGSKEKAESLK